MNEETKGFIDELIQRTDVLGIVLFGSWARGNNRPDSDIDLVVILTEGFQRTVEYRNKQAFEIIYTTKDGAFEYWESHKDDGYGLWEVAQILYDKDGSVKELESKVKKMLAAGKKPIDELQLGQFRFDAADQIKYVESIYESDPTLANFILTNKIFRLTELFFDLRQMWTPAPKQRLDKINEISPEIYSLLSSFYREETPLKVKVDVAQKILPLVFDEQ